MAIIVVGGHSRNIGKTSVVCGLIFTMPERSWTAIKITQCHHHATGSEPCDCELAGHAIAISEERNATTGTDSSRYLAAGAARSFWVRTRQGKLAEAMPRLFSLMDAADSVIIESNSVLGFLQPDLYATVLDPEIAGFKASALRYLDRAGAVLSPEGAVGPPAGSSVSHKLIEGVPQFRIGPPRFCSDEFVSFVAQKLDRPQP